MFYACFALIGSWEGGKKFMSRDFKKIKICKGRVTGNKQLFLGLRVACKVNFAVK